MRNIEPQPYESICDEPIAVIPLDAKTRANLECRDQETPYILVDSIDSAQDALAWCSPNGAQTALFGVCRNLAADAADCVVLCSDGIAGTLDPVTADIIDDMLCNEDITCTMPSAPVIATIAYADMTTDLDVTDVIRSLDRSLVEPDIKHDEVARKALFDVVAKTAHDFGLIPWSMPVSGDDVTVSAVSERSLQTLRGDILAESACERRTSQTEALRCILEHTQTLREWRKSGADIAADLAATRVESLLARIESDDR